MTTLCLDEFVQQQTALCTVNACLGHAMLHGRQSSEHEDVENDQCCSLSHQGEQLFIGIVKTPSTKYLIHVNQQHSYAMCRYIAMCSIEIHAADATAMHAYATTAAAAAAAAITIRSCRNTTTKKCKRASLWRTTKKRSATMATICSFMLYHIVQATVAHQTVLKAQALQIAGDR
eukprot:1313-Heterococcus_DN1.PRE.1